MVLFVLPLLLVLGASADTVERCETIVASANPWSSDPHSEFGGSDGFEGQGSGNWSGSGDDNFWRGGGDGNGSINDGSDQPEDWNNEDSEYARERRQIEIDGFRERIRELREAIAETKVREELLGLRRELAQAMNYLISMAPRVNTEESYEYLALMVLTETNFSLTDPLISDLRSGRVDWRNNPSLPNSDVEKVKKFLQAHPAVSYEARAFEALEVGNKIYWSFANKVPADNKDVFEAGIALVQASFQVAINDLGISGDLLGGLLEPEFKDMIIGYLRRAISSMDRLSEVPWQRQIPNLRNFGRTLDLETPSYWTLQRISQMNDGEGQSRYMRSLWVPAVHRIQYLEQEGARSVQVRKAEVQKAAEIQGMLSRAEAMIRQERLSGVRLLLIQVDQVVRSQSTDINNRYLDVLSEFIEAVRLNNSERLSDIPTDTEEQRATPAEYWSALYYLISANDLYEKTAESQENRKMIEAYAEFLVLEARQLISASVLKSPLDSWQRQAASDLSDAMIAMTRSRSVRDQVPLELFERIKSRVDGWSEPAPVLPSGPKDIRKLLETQIEKFKARFKR